MEFETSLAKVSRKLEDLRDPVRNYNKMTLADVRQKHTPSIAWDDRLAAWNLHPSYVVVGQPEFFTGVEALLKKLGGRNDFQRSLKFNVHQHDVWTQL